MIMQTQSSAKTASSAFRTDCSTGIADQRSPPSMVSVGTSCTAVASTRGVVGA